VNKKYFYWDFAAKKYDFWRNLEMNSDIQVAKNIANKIQVDDNVLEIACGTGRLSCLILNKTQVPFNYLATDISSQMINVCKNKTSELKFQIADATNLEYEDKSFNHIIIGNALHIMPKPEKALAEAYRVLKDDGLLHAPQFLTPSTVREKFILNITRLLGYKVFNEFELDSYLSFLESNGFKATKKEIYTCFRNMLYVSCNKKSIDEEKQNSGHSKIRI